MWSGKHNYKLPTSWLSRGWLLRFPARLRDETGSIHGRRVDTIVWVLNRWLITVPFMVGVESPSSPFRGVVPEDRVRRGVWIEATIVCSRSDEMDKRNWLPRFVDDWVCNEGSLFRLRGVGDEVGGRALSVLERARLDRNWRISVVACTGAWVRTGDRRRGAPHIFTLHVWVCVFCLCRGVVRHSVSVPNHYTTRGVLQVLQVVFDGFLNEFFPINSLTTTQNTRGPLVKGNIRTTARYPQCFVEVVLKVLEDQRGICENNNDYSCSYLCVYLFSVNALYMKYATRIWWEKWRNNLRKNIKNTNNNLLPKYQT